MQQITNIPITNNQNCLPMNPYLSDEEISYIVRSL